MKRILILTVSAVLLGCGARDDKSHKDHGKEEKKGNGDHGGHNASKNKAVLMVETEPATVEAGKATVLKLMINDRVHAVPFVLKVD